MATNGTGELHESLLEDGIATERDEIWDKGKSMESERMVNTRNIDADDCLMEAGALGQGSERLASLDVFRGLSIAVMILVDDAGGVWPAINHSPWNGVTLADFVMPFFLFIVGVALALSYKRVTSKPAATVKATSRALKLLTLGIMLQGGYYHGLNDLSYGVDLEVIRWCGILQRIALSYLVVSLCEIWSKRIRSEGPFAIFKMYSWNWAVAGLLSTFYLVILYGVFVPDWEFMPEWPATSTSVLVKCGVRGDVSPACNAVGFIDRSLLGVTHLYLHPVFQRTKDCSVNSPDYGPTPPGAPSWCQAPFDPEGLLSSVSAVTSCFVGLHHGHVLVHYKAHKVRMMHWFLLSLGLLILGTVLHFLGMPLNKPLYSFSYVCLTAGAAGLVFMVLYLFVDVYSWRRPTVLLEWMGKNSLLIFALAATGVAAAAIQGFYVKTPRNNLVNFVEEHIFGALFPTERTAKLAYVLFQIFLWSLVAGVLQSERIFLKF